MTIPRVVPVARDGLYDRRCMDPDRPVSAVPARSRMAAWIGLLLIAGACACDGAESADRGAADDGGAASVGNTSDDGGRDALHREDDEATGGDATGGDSNDDEATRDEETARDATAAGDGPIPRADAPPGRWANDSRRRHERRRAEQQLDGVPDGAPDSDLNDEQLEALRRLESIGYATSQGEAGSGPVGVVKHLPQRASPGLNLVLSGHAPVAALIDMDGRLLHRWRCRFDQAFPGRTEAEGLHDNGNRKYWRRVRILPEGDLLVIFEGLGLVRLDHASQVRWAWAGGAHHDVDVTPDGRIVLLTREARLDPELHPTEPVLEDFVVQFDADGRELASLSVLGSLLNLIDERRASADETFTMEGIDTGGDVLHTNTIQYIDAALGAASSVADEGDVLVSMRELDRLAVIDLESGQMTWTARGPWRAQHEPVLLADGNMLLFDNKGHENRSSVLEFDPVTQEIAWSYGKERPLAFYSATCGSAQRLANGNTLITESDQGRAFEIDRDHLVVWDYQTPFRAGPQDELIATLFEVVRLGPEFPTDWMD